MERDSALSRPSEGLSDRRRLPAGRQLAQGLAKEESVPLDREGARHEYMIVLEELPERDEDLAEVRDDADVSRETLRRVRIRHLDEVSRVQDDEGTLDRVAGSDGARLPGAFDLDLRPDRDEVVEDVHRRGM